LIPTGTTIKIKPGNHVKPIYDMICHIYFWNFGNDVFSKIGKFPASMKNDRFNHVQPAHQARPCCLPSHKTKVIAIENGNNQKI
jgi:hypothetical protein